MNTQTGSSKKTRAEMTVPERIFESARAAKKFTKNKLTKTKGLHRYEKWRHIDFDTETGHEYYGIVDLVAIKRVKNKKGQLDDLEIVLFQVKGGKSPLNDGHIERLKNVKVRVTWNIATKRGKKVEFAIPLAECFKPGARKRYRDSLLRV